MIEKILTVSVAAYNGAKTLSKALDSCLCRKMGALEVLVVDDGSSDETPEIVAQYEKLFPGTFRLIRQCNRGYGSTINRTIADASGRYFRTLDCDDWFSPGCVESFIEYLQNCTSDMIYTNYQTVYHNTEKDRFDVCAGRCAEKMYRWEELESGLSCMQMHAMTFRTAMLRQAGFTLPEHCYYTDMLYTFCGAQASESIQFCPVQLYNYRLGRDGQSVGLKSYQNHMDDFIKVVCCICERAGLLGHETIKENILRHRAGKVAQEGIELYLRFPFHKETWKELCSYDKLIRNEFPEIAQEMTNKDTALLRKSQYFLFPALTLYKQSKSSAFASRPFLHKT